MKHIMALLLIAGLSGCGTCKETAAGTRAIDKQTFLYAVKEGRELFLDRLIDSSVVYPGRKPVFIYSFSGAWEKGQRSETQSMPFLEFIARKGCVVAAIDYRLWIKEIKEKHGLNEDNAAENYMKALDKSVDDLLSATSYIISQAQSWNIDPQMIVLGGSGSGAANSLKAEYLAGSEPNLHLKFLPEGFNYAGVVAMDGDLWLSGGDHDLHWNKKPCPHLFIHGSGDHAIRFNKTAGAGFSSYGPEFYYRNFSRCGYPAWFYEIQNNSQNRDSIENFDYCELLDYFLTKFVEQKQLKILYTVDKKQT